VSAGQNRISIGSVTLNNPGPYLAVLPKGETVVYDYSARREQWAVIFDMPELSAGKQAGMVEFAEETGGDHVTLPMFTPVVPEHISGWDGEFLRMREAFQAPCPLNRLRVRTGVSNVIRYVIDRRRDIYPSAVAKLRWLVDEDQEARFSLEELSRQCGYSASRLRVLFEREYGQSPQAYRNKRRMQLAADLLCNSDQRIKEISKRVGCRHVSHFSALFKSAFGRTPSEYQAGIRHL
jgi:AraC-like DNA-binding protein